MLSVLNPGLNIIRHIKIKKLRLKLELANTDVNVVPFLNELPLTLQLNGDI